MNNPCASVLKSMVWGGGLPQRSKFPVPAAFPTVQINFDTFYLDIALNSIG